MKTGSCAQMEEEVLLEEASRIEGWPGQVGLNSTRYISAAWAVEGRAARRGEDTSWERVPLKARVQYCSVLPYVVLWC